MPTFQDLAGFWDLLQLSIEDVTLKFLELQQLKANSWKLLEPQVGGSLQAKSAEPGKCPSPESVGGGEEGRRRDPGQPGQTWTGDGDPLRPPSGSLPFAWLQGKNHLITA